MNDAGAVAYQATLTAGGQGIFRAAGGTTTPIASGTFVSPIVSINGLGAVAYAEGSCPSGGGIYLGVEITKKKW